MEPEQRQTRDRATGTTAPAVRLALAQTSPLLRDAAANVTRIAGLAPRGADVLLTPELSVTGYGVGDAVHRLAEPLDGGVPSALAPLASLGCTVIAGMIERAPGGPYNTALALADGSVRFRHRKLYLPTYGMFDEGRFFGRGTALDTFEAAPGWRTGVLVCEDFWHPGLVYALAARGIDLLLVQAAAPGRGVWEGGATGAFASADVWERMVRSAAQMYGIYVALANRVGVEGGVTFAGGSIIAAPDGSVLARAGDGEEALLEAELTKTALATSRTPYAHSRDDDPRLVLRELQRGLDMQDAGVTHGG